MGGVVTVMSLIQRQSITGGSRKATVPVERYVHSAQVAGQEVDCSGAIPAFGYASLSCVAWRSSGYTGQQLRRMGLKAAASLTKRTLFCSPERAVRMGQIPALVASVAATLGATFKPGSRNRSARRHCRAHGMCPAQKKPPRGSRGLGALVTRYASMHHHGALRRTVDAQIGTGVNRRRRPP